MTLVYAYDKPLDIPAADVRRLLGGKAANLAEMASRLHLSVPPGFTVTTVGCNAFLANGWPPELDAQLRAAMTGVEETVGRRFGDPVNPLLVSVRSGAPVSMPGMMDTILDLGLNDATTAGLAAATGDPAFAADCRQRFQALFSSVVRQAPPDDPWLQLRAAVEAVFRSWNSERAQTYRRREHIPDDLGTAVTVQAMVFGNSGPDSATGVLFTRNPATGAPTLYGDVLFNAQGEDVVAGTHQTQPIAVLEEQLPEVGSELRRAANALEHHFADLCDIEFTVEHGRLWLLQVRVGKRSPQAALRIAMDMANDPGFPLSRADAVRRVASYLAHPPTASVTTDLSTAVAMGLPASPGVASGEIVTSPDDVAAVVAAGRSAILCRAETSPDDVRGMTHAAGILTSRGGLASHAAVVARGWGIPAVVGARSVSVTDHGLDIDGRVLPSGSLITIDGSSGAIFEGAVDGASGTLEEVGVLLGWAHQLGIPIGEDDADLTPAPSPTAAAIGQATVADGQTRAPETPRTGQDDLIRALSIKGLVTSEMLAPAVGAPVDVVGALADCLVTAGLAERAAGAVRLTATGKEQAAVLMAADRAALGEQAAEAALDAFIELDQRTKATVTAWQLKEAGAEPVLNDHSDAAYDARVLADLASLHADAESWIEPVCKALPRLAGYRERLATALERACAGDPKYVASPRVDSYHSVWFELHEELIQLAGRNRADETAAGRA